MPGQAGAGERLARDAKRSIGRSRPDRARPSPAADTPDESRSRPSRPAVPAGRRRAPPSHSYPDPGPGCIACCQLSHRCLPRGSIDPGAHGRLGRFPQRSLQCVRGQDRLPGRPRSVRPLPGGGPLHVSGRSAPTIPLGSRSSTAACRVTRSSFASSRDVAVLTDERAAYFTTIDYADGWPGRRRGRW